MHNTKRKYRLYFRRAQSLVLFTVAMLLLLVASDYMLRAAMRANSLSRVNWLFNSTPDEYDVAILGSSLAKEGIDPGQLSQETGLEIVQLAWGGRGVAEQSLYWELFLQRHACNTLFLELHPRGLEIEAFPHPLDQFRYFQRLDEPAVQRHVARHCGKWRTLLWRFFPMWGVAEFNTQIGWHDLLALRHRDRFDPNAMGGSSIVRTERELDEQRTSVGKPGDRAIDERSTEQFLEILEQCRDKSIRVVAFYPPQYGGMAEADLQSFERYQRLIDQHVPELDITYFTVSHVKYAEQTAYYQDAFHLNSHGCREFTSDLGKFLRDNSQ